MEPFRYYQYGERTVHLDGCVEVEAAYYGAPPGWIGRRVQVQWDLRQVRLLDPQTGQLLREHLRQTRGRHRIKAPMRNGWVAGRGAERIRVRVCRALGAGVQLAALAVSSWGQAASQPVRWQGQYTQIYSDDIESPGPHQRRTE